MSAGFEAWARSQTLDGWAHSRHVLLERLASEANHEGIAIARLEDLARDIGRTMREVQRLIRSLEAAGKIQRIPRFMRRQVANAYRLLTDWVQAQLERRIAPPAAPEDAAAGTGEPRGHADTVTGPWTMGKYLDHHPDR